MLIDGSTASGQNVLSGAQTSGARFRYWQGYGLLSHSGHIAVLSGRFQFSSGEQVTACILRFEVWQ